MLSAFALAFAQLGERPMLAVLGKSLALTLALFALAGGGLYLATRALLAGSAADLPGLAAGVAVVATVALGWLLFRAVAIAVVGLFGDAIVIAVERRHYPAAAAAARPIGFARSAAMGLGSAGRALGWNLAASPLYLAALFTGFGLPAALLAVNGWLLGRDLGDLPAARHLGRSQLSAWRARTRGPRFVVGLATAALLVVPVANLLAPVVGAAAMTHLFHRRRGAEGAA